MTSARTRPTDRPSVRGRLRSGLSHHAASSVASIAELLRAPVATLLTVAVIAIAVALPAGLLVLVTNACVQFDDFTAAENDVDFAWLDIAIFNADVYEDFELAAFLDRRGIDAHICPTAGQRVFQ